MKDYEIAAKTLQERAEALGLSVEWDFVPFSKSRNKDEKNPSLNWRYTLKRGDRVALSGDYMQGCAHCPAYKDSVHKLGHSHSTMRDDAVRHECETGRAARRNNHSPSGAKIAPPLLSDLLHSLLLDSDAINHATYEDWADDFGYDKDSRKGEAIYRACLETGLRLRASLGDAAMQALSELAREM